MHLVNPDECATGELVVRSVMHTGPKSTIIYLQLPSDHPMRRQRAVSMSRERPLRGAVPLEQGPSETLEYFENLIAHHAATSIAFAP
jgi:hypothetical protein